LSGPADDASLARGCACVTGAGHALSVRRCHMLTIIIIVLLILLLFGGFGYSRRGRM
jgi:hypothetical protein